MIIIKSDREIALMREAGHIVAEVFEATKAMCKPGVSTLALAREAEKVIRSHGAIPTFLNYGGFKGAVCVSVNDTLIHGIPSAKEVLKDGDIVSIDVGATYKGYVSDACRTFYCGNVSEENKRLVEVTEQSFFEAMKYVKPGAHLGDISHAIQTYCEAHGYSLPRDYTGHGVGLNLHEDPMIPNYGPAGVGPILRKGMCLAIEPMVAMGHYDTKVLGDGWTVKMRDGKNSSHYENTIVVTDDGYEILSVL